MMLDRIEALDGYLKSYATVTAERALDAARQAEIEISTGRYRGRLHGVPVAVKDVFYTRGTVTRGGLGVMENLAPSDDATVVTRLESAGAVLLGKLNLSEGAMAAYHPGFNIPVNPWGEEYWSGISSSGCGAATAAGLCFASVGTDSGGSIRLPALVNGVVGLKPTYGRVSRFGLLPLSKTLDHVGPMTRRVADAELVFQVIAGYDPKDSTSLPDPVGDMGQDCSGRLDGVRIGFDQDYTLTADDDGLVQVIHSVQETLQSLGASVVEVEMPPETLHLGRAWFDICAADACRVHAAHYPAQADDYGPYLRQVLEHGSVITLEKYSAAMQLRADFSRQFSAILKNVDAVICPSGRTGITLGETNQYGDMQSLNGVLKRACLHFTLPASLAGTPALTLPCGFSAAGMPYGVQFMGRRLSESVLCRIGHSYENATDWHKRHPDL
jgi:amidase